MKHIFSVFILLLLLPTLYSQSISKIINETTSIVVGKVIHENKRICTFKNIENIIGENSLDTISILKTYYSRNNDSLNYKLGNEVILFLNKNRNRYNEVDYSIKEIFINKDSVEYFGELYSVTDFIQAVKEMKENYSLFCDDLQNGEKNTSILQKYKTTSIIHLKLYSEIEEKCYYDISYKQNVSAVISPLKMNVLYVGVKNPIKIAVPNVSSNDLKITVQSGEGLKYEDYYNVEIFRPGLIQICVYNKNYKDSLYSCMKFRGKIIPDPVATYLNSEGGEISKAWFCAGRTLNADMRNFDYDLQFTITSFTVTIVSQGKSISYKNYGNKLSQEIKQAFELVKKGDKVFFEDILVITPSLGKRRLGVLLFKII